MSLLVDDAHSAAARDWVRRDASLRLVSDFGWGEFVATLGRKVRGREVSGDEANQLLAAARNYFERWRWAEVVSADVETATEFVARFDLGLRLPDAIHLAIARRNGATVITTDRRQSDAAAALGIGYVDPTRPA